MNLDTPTLAGFLSAKFSIDPAEITPATPLFSSGLLDSFHLLELISFVEERAKIRISPGEISLDNLDTPERIVRFVERKQAP
ncbi:MAG TPA: acyl carrier protein [Candidatus Limnocylindria bacterium]|nr:acyl carrier protein [Candidatus Limnocylindria bacterium]